MRLITKLGPSKIKVHQYGGDEINLSARNKKNMTPFVSSSTDGFQRLRTENIAALIENSGLTATQPETFAKD